MKTSSGNPPGKKAMRVSTIFAGAVAIAAGFGPAAQAAPDNPPVPQPYTLWVNTKSSIYSIQVCGYKDVGGGQWTCTVKHHNPYYGQIYSGHPYHSNYFGGNWKRGKINVWEWRLTGNSSSEWGHTCNTNGSYHGIFRTGGVSLSGGFRFPLGASNSEC